MPVTNHGNGADKVAQALVSFSVDGEFPDESVSALPVTQDVLPAGIEALSKAKASLEAEVHRINEETADDVRSWKTNAQSVQDDILRSKTLANEILKRAEAPEASGKAIDDIEAKADLLIRELNYNQQVQQALKGIRGVNQILDQVEEARNDRRILDALHLLERSRAAIDAVPVSKSVRVLKLLNIRTFELEQGVHHVFDRVWSSLVHVDVESGRFIVRETIAGEHMALTEAVKGLKAYNEIEKRATDLWHDLDAAIITPRMNILQENIPGISADDTIVSRTGTADKTTHSLLADLETVLSFLVRKLPRDLVEIMSSTMMPDLTARIKNVWLDPVVPPSLKDMDEFQDVIASTQKFCETLNALGLQGLDELRDWAENAPKVWLSKCREAALDSVRRKLSQGIGAAKGVERVEKKQVSNAEGKQLVANGALASSEDHGWDAEWSDDEKDNAPGDTKSSSQPTADDSGADDWGDWGDDDAPDESTDDHGEGKKEDEDDPAEAWGWGDDDANQDEAQKARAPHGSRDAATASSLRELTLRESYHISSMPEPVLSLVFAILEDGALLTQDGYNASPVVASAAGLFNLPTFALAMFRAVSPYYYSLDSGGNMYLYNDATYLAERLTEFAANWKTRDDLSKRAQSMLRLDKDINSLRSFASRAYSHEMTIQKTVLRDQLGGEQNLMHQEDKGACVDAAVSRVRAMALTWDAILARSAWYQAVGSLADALSLKIIADVMDTASISQDEAYNIAELIAAVTGLDDLFRPARAAAATAVADEEEGAEAMPVTAQYAPSWLKLKYLSEVLQSNLRDVRYLWMESELSYYFSAAEVVDLVNLSFEDNARTRDVIREITGHPRPREQA